MRWKRSTKMLLWGALIASLPIIGFGWWIRTELFYDPTVWTEDVASPDGDWVATATTKQWGGFGSAWVETTVTLRSTTSAKFIVNDRKPFDIFSYPGGGITKAYVVSAENADKELAVRWQAPNHLLIGHQSPVEPDLAVVRWSTVDVEYDPGTFAASTHP